MAAPVSVEDVAPSIGGDAEEASLAPGVAGTGFKLEGLDPRRETVLEDWKSSQALAEAMIPIIGDLYRNRNIVPTVYGQPLVNQNLGVIPIITVIDHAHKVFDPRISITEVYKLLRATQELVDIHTLRLDIGRCLKAMRKADVDTTRTSGARSWLEKHLVPTIPKDTMNSPRDVVLYGFGRIGRLLARLLVQKTGSGGKLALRAIVCRPKPGDLRKRASLFELDSVHGKFEGTVEVDEETSCLIINGNVIQLIHAKHPKDVDYTKYGITNAIVIDNTGVWRDTEGLSQHLMSKGAAKVLLTAPGKGDDVVTVVAGLNEDRVLPDTNIYSCASCTTNAIVPVLNIVAKRFGIKDGHLETVHSFTNDQNLIDNYHAKPRRGRSAVLNMVVTSTGAASAVSRALPFLAGKLTGSAIRVPTPDVSMAVMILNLETETTKDELNAVLKKNAMEGALHHQIDYCEEEDAVSTDFVGTRATGIVDGLNTIVKGSRVNLYVWYDNEFGYACQVIRVLQRVADVQFMRFPSSAVAGEAALGGGGGGGGGVDAGATPPKVE